MVRKTFEYFCSKCGRLRSKNEWKISGPCLFCGEIYAILKGVEWKDEWLTYAHLEQAYLSDEEILRNLNACPY